MNADNIMSLQKIQRCKQCGRSKLDDNPKCPHCGCAWPILRGKGVNKKKPISITRTCKDCNNPAKINGLCEMHYDQQRPKNFSDKYRENTNTFLKNFLKKTKRKILVDFQSL